jgi:hypothetical protein
LIDDVPLQAQAPPGRIPMMELLVRYGADVNARADVDVNGVGSQTAIFHALADVSDTISVLNSLLLPDDFPRGSLTITR